MLSRNDLALRNHGRRAQKRWERSIRSQDRHWRISPTSAFSFGSNAANQFSETYRPFRYPLSTPGSFATTIAALPMALAYSFGSVLSSIPMPVFSVSSHTCRRFAYTLAGVSITGLALAATAITKGYVDHPEQFWTERIAKRMQSPIFGRDNTLIGSVGPQQDKLAPDQAREYAYVPLQGDIPKTYVQALLRMENRHYLEGGLHNMCGLGIETAWRWVANPGSGGSTLSMQLAKQLMQPDLGQETHFLQKVWRKGIEIGASCQLYNALAKIGGATEVLRMYASYAPTFQGNGTLRGIEAASRIVFDDAPNDLSDAKQLILAAAARKPLTLLPPGATDIDCKRVFPRKDNPQYEPETARLNTARAVQCQVVHRAIIHAPMVLEGDRRRVAIAELHEYEAKGIHPVNPFEPIPSKKLVNLASRTAAAMPKGLLAQIRQEADEASILRGAPLYVSLDAVQQHEFHQAMTAALERIQRTPYMQRTLCLPLVNNEEKPLNLPDCKSPDLARSADVLAVNADVATGGFKTIYASSPLLMASNQSIGSIAKWIVIVAALADGVQPDDMLCPKAARDGDRRLKRVAAPEYGFESCNGGSHLMTWERATATSDNLAYYQLAQQLGTARLAAAATTLGLGDPTATDKLAYEVSFGTYGATPRDLISAFQALVAVAYDIKTTGHAPRALRNASNEQNPAIKELKALLPTQVQRNALRQLLEAPVQSTGGTLAFLKSRVTSGKSGTVQSAIKGPNGRLYNHGKWALTYQHDKGSINLFFVASPLPNVPLAQHDLSASVLMPAHIQTLTQE